MALAGLSTLGIRFFYGCETTAGTKPSSFTELSRINSIGGVAIDTEAIDASALDDLVTRNVAGRGGLSGNFDVDVNITPETIEEWQDLIDAYQALTNGKRMWFEIVHPTLSTQAFFVVAQPPQAIPIPESGQNALWTVTFSLVVEELVGIDTPVIPTPPTP